MRIADLFRSLGPAGTEPLTDHGCRGHGETRGQHPGEVLRLHGDVLGGHPHRAQGVDHAGIANVDHCLEHRSKEATAPTFRMRQRSDQLSRLRTDGSSGKSSLASEMVMFRLSTTVQPL